MFLTLLPGLAGPSVYAQGNVPEIDDSYHFKYWQPSPYNIAYNEWWYFNLYDEKNNIQAIFTYQVADPADLSGQGGGDLTAVVYQPNQTVTESDLYPLSSFTASYSSANVTLGPNKISVKGANLYLLTGATMDGRLSWELSYERQAPSWFAGDHIDVGPPSWEQMSWLLYMPRAKVSGTLTVDGHAYKVECSGYHDHNWGQWNFASVVWNWAQYSQPGLTFDLGDFTGNPNGRASLDVLGKRVVFSASQYKLVHTKWAFDSIDNLSYPIQSVFTAENDDVTVRIVMNAQSTDPLATGPPPSLVIYEQTCHFKGTVTVQSKWFPIETSFEGDGFKEYTATSAP
jgi:hypothetical protein